MPFAYITQSGTVLRKRGRQLLLQDGEGTIARFGLAHLESLLIRGNVQITAAAMKSLLASGIDTTILSQKGKLLGRIIGPQSGAVSLRMAQYALLQNQSHNLKLARQTVTQKLEAMLELIDRHRRNYSHPVLKQSRQKITETLEKIPQAVSSESLLGLEGIASLAYWNGFRVMNRSPLGFYGRSRRPPRDEMNALLSLGYVILSNEIRALTESIGLDPHLGYYHKPKQNRPSLALDLVEPFRHLIIDRMVLKLCNLGRIKPAHITGSEAEGFSLDRAGWKIMLTEYETSLLAAPSGFMEDLFPQARSWRELIQKQTLHLRRTLLNKAENELSDCEVANCCE